MATQTYRGNFHCGAFVFEFDAPEIKDAYVCDCSICHKRGYLWAPAGTDTFRVVKGSLDELTSYQFGPKILSHLFCPTCGIGIGGKKGENEMGINLRTVQGLDMWGLKAIE